MRLYGLIGYPLKNSFSENYFNQRFSEEQIEAVYRNFRIEDIGLLKNILSENPDLLGLNVTIPHKQSVMPLLDELDLTALETGAVNTIKIEAGKLTGYNTDIYGFEKSLLPLLQPWHQQALVLGYGGAAKAVIHVLKKLGLRYSVVSRDNNNGLGYDEVDRSIIRTHQVIINCTPLGMAPDTGSSPPIPYEFITDMHLAYDLVYHPEETEFFQKCRQQGAVTKNGLQMLHLQASKAWDIWEISGS